MFSLGCIILDIIYKEELEIISIYDRDNLSVDISKLF